MGKWSKKHMRNAVEAISPNHSTLMHCLQGAIFLVKWNSEQARSKHAYERGSFISRHHPPASSSTPRTTPPLNPPERPRKTCEAKNVTSVTLLSVALTGVRAVSGLGPIRQKTSFPSQLLSVSVLLRLKSLTHVPPESERYDGISVLPF